MRTELGGPLVSRGDLLFAIVVMTAAAVLLIVAGIFA